jgi:hypothetical protein
VESRRNYSNRGQRFLGLFDEITKVRVPITVVMADEKNVAAVVDDHPAREMDGRDPG